MEIKEMFVLSNGFRIIAVGRAANKAAAKAKAVAEVTPFLALKRDIRFTGSRKRVVIGVEER